MISWMLQYKPLKNKVMPYSSGILHFAHCQFHQSLISFVLSGSSLSFLELITDQGSHCIHCLVAGWASSATVS